MQLREAYDACPENIETDDLTPLRAHVPTDHIASIVPLAFR